MPNIEAWELKAKLFEKKCIAMEKDVAKVCPLTDATAIKAKMKANRKMAYDLEDKLSETIPAAIKKGITGKKWKDFFDDKDFKKALGEWEASLAEQQNLVKSLEDLSNNAKKRFQEFKRARDGFEKEMKKAGESEKDNQTVKKWLDKSSSVLAELTLSKSAFGTLKAKEAFFGANLKKSRDLIVTKALKEGKGDELPDMLLENAKRGQTDTKAKRLGRNITKFTTHAKMLCAKEKFETIPTANPAKNNLEKDVQSAKACLKKAAEHLKNLEGINKELQAAKKKQAKLIAAHNEQGKMNALINTVAAEHKAGEDAFNAAEDLVEEADSKL
ncbi:hypothetical protein [Sedimentitalea todarodis]|uniref:Uncharacterized protein n=1 Tax=Sedimentitalea todarodis TaxID=1631240 RepID=A0ABU3VBT0_9RHOB|nr:hypothetical protein [Sedimentitalea todarodis]MDU9003194.1 hypothetical protein [Sedimentitalea todarodis]